jgi:DNA-binding transcriptional MerR regulator
MDQKEYLIHELAEKANVTVRTIRYYMVEGLLPTPTTRSKYALFSQEHLDRLDLIRRLKEIHLPLEEIREILQDANDEEIANILGISEERSKLSPLPPVSIKEHAPGKAALDYISEIRNARSAIQRKDYSSPDLSRPLNSIPQPAPGVRPGPETWQRIQLAPGVELNIRNTTDPVLRAKIIELVRLSQELFKKK